VRRSPTRVYMEWKPDRRVEYRRRLRRQKGIPRRRYRETMRDPLGLLMARCCACGAFKYLVEFTRRKNRPLGITYDCNDCRAMAMRQGRSKKTAQRQTHSPRRQDVGAVDALGAKKS